MPQVTVGDRKVNYLDGGGPGDAILFLHAFPLHARMWEPQLEALGDRFRLIRPDLLGFGESEAPDDPSEYSVEAFADQAKAVLDDAGLQQAVVVGLSLGGYVALAFHRRHPAAVRALVLADTRAESDTDETRSKRTNQQELVRAEGPGALVDGMLGALLSQGTRDSKPDVVENARSLMDNPGPGYIGALEAMKNRPDSTASLAQIDVPTLVLVGEDDTLTPPELSRSLHERIGGARLVVLPDAGHLSNLEAPNAFNGAVAEFVAAL